VGGRIFIGLDCQIGAYCSICTTVMGPDGQEQTGHIYIGDRVVLNPRVTILPGVVLADDTIVPPGAIVRAK
jgi:acetyltransferase-like isoleucine patch superfamily enzyme